MNKLYLLLALTVCAFYTKANTVFVTNTNDTGSGSLRDVINVASDDDTVRFDPNLLLNGNDTIHLSSFLTINKRLTILGLFSQTDTLFINGQSLVSPLVVGFPSNYVGLRNVTLENLSLLQGLSIQSTPSILAISESVDTLRIKNCLFRNGTSDFGGAITSNPPISSNTGAPMVYVQSCSFENNHANRFGGALSTYHAKFVIQHCAFKNNSATDNGGALYFHAEDVSEVNHSIFMHNDADLGGGISVHFTDTVLVSHCFFTGNHAQNDGGAIHSNGALHITATQLDSNSASSRGGALLAGFFSSALVIDSSSFTRNTGNFGGAIAGQTDMDIRHSNFERNSASPGGALYFTSATVNIARSTFSNNFSSNNGGAINANQFGTLHIAYSTIANNTATGLGGGIYAFEAFNVGSFSLRNSTVTNNTAFSGNGIAFRTNSNFPLDATFESSIVAGNGHVNVRIFNDSITSLGYNVFGDTTVVGSVSSDQLAISDSALSVRPIGFYGGFTKTAPPNIGSSAINAGNPLNATDAQNGATIGVRDAGAAEGRGIYKDTIEACTQAQWYGNNYTSSGNYVELLPNGDTVATLNLTIIPFTTGTDVVTSCIAYTWTNGVTYTSNNNTATDTLVNSTGCDSIVTLNLTITPPSAGIETVTACDSYTWSNGVTYTNSTNGPTDTLLTTSGCDSIVTLNLTVNLSKSAADSLRSCSPITWIDGVTYNNTNSTATFTLPASNGCDSVVTLHYTRLATSASTDQVLACKSFTWIDGNTYTSSNNSATFTLTNAEGCDSLVTLDLTIPNINTGVTLNSPNLTSDASMASYQWLDCDSNFAPIVGATSQTFTAVRNGNYAVSVTQQGCTDTSQCVSISSLSHEGSYALSQVVVYPNPVGNRVEIRGIGPETKEIRLLDLAGRVVLNRKVKKSKIHIQVGNLASGMYTLVLLSETGKECKRIQIL